MNEKVCTQKQGMEHNNRPSPSPRLQPITKKKNWEGPIQTREPAVIQSGKGPMNSF